MRRDIRRPRMRDGTGHPTAISQVTRQVHRKEETKEQYIQYTRHRCQERLCFETGERVKVCYGLPPGGMSERERFVPMIH